MTSPNQPRTMRVLDRRLRRVGLGSAAAVSAVVGVLTATLVFLTGLALWRLGVGSGVVARVEEVGATLSADGTFELDGAALFGGWVALAVLWAATITVLGVVLAMIVNLGCLLTGGLRLRFTTKPVVVVEGERVRRRVRPIEAAAAGEDERDEERDEARKPIAA
jgi:hypothetical protein